MRAVAVVLVARVANLVAELAASELVVLRASALHSPMHEVKRAEVRASAVVDCAKVDLHAGVVHELVSGVGAVAEGVVLDVPADVRTSAVVHEARIRIDTRLGAVSVVDEPGLVRTKTLNLPIRVLAPVRAPRGVAGVDFVASAPDQFVVLRTQALCFVVQSDANVRATAVLVLTRIVLYHSVAMRGVD